MKKFLGVVAAIIAAVVIGYKLAYPYATVNHRLTLEVGTPEGMRTGSGVIAVTYGLRTGVLEQSFHFETRGEAVAVDLGSRGTLYALLCGPKGSGSDMAFFRFRDAFGIQKAIDPHKVSSVLNFAATTGTRELKGDLVPMLVRFRDESDPKTVEAVDPKNLATAFGEGVRLERVTMEVTEESVTTGIEKRLGWLSGYPEPNLDPGGPLVGGPAATAPLRRQLKHGDFRRK